MRKARIAIIAHGCRAGGGLFGTLNLLKALKNVTEDEQILLVCSGGYGYEDVELPPNSEVFVYNGGHSPLQRYWFEAFALPKLVVRYSPDVIFGPGNIGLTRPSVPQALFIRQAYLFYEEQYYPDIDWRYRLRIAALRLQIRKSLQSTGLIFAQTPVVKKRFAKRFNYPADRISILRFPPPLEIEPVQDIQALDRLGKKPGDFFILLLTRYMPHRNPGILIPMCKRYGKKLRSQQIRFVTTVEKKDGHQAAKFLAEISENQLEDIIFNVGELTRSDVSKYYASGNVLWLPTTLETLGLPFLEAMAVGLPILAPDLDFARYVCGDAAVFYNPWDIDSIFDNIIFMRENSRFRKQLIETGRSQLKDRRIFSETWEEVASDVLRGLRTLVD